MSDALELIREEPAALTHLPRLSVAAIQQRVADIERVIDTLMVKGTHFGPPFPGSDKDSLLQPGAELMVEAFGLAPEPEVQEVELDGGHKRFIVSGPLLTPDGRAVGRMRAECTTMEPKYRYRRQQRQCPTCGAEAIMQSKFPDKASGRKGWYCNRKADGCGAQFPEDSPEITSQEVGRAEHPDPAELWHTCAAMAQKRWLVAIVRRTFALSARFVDEDAAQAGLFDWQRVAPLLKSLPGERVAKWDRVILHCLSEFGKDPKHITNLEGASVITWLSAEVARSGQLERRDFMPSPESDSCGAAGMPVSPKAGTTEPSADPPTNGREPLPEKAREAFRKALRAAGRLDEAGAEFGPPDTWTRDLEPALRDLASRKRAEP